MNMIEWPTPNRSSSAPSADATRDRMSPARLMRSEMHCRLRSSVRSPSARAAHGSSTAASSRHMPSVRSTATTS